VLRQVCSLTGAEVIEHDDAVAGTEQPIDGVRADESSAARNDRKHAANYTWLVLGSRP
jgi:hypothetical protein